MFEKIIRFAIEQRWLVLLCVLGMAALGIFSYQRLPIDAVPDITNVQVQINTQAKGYSPLEAEQRVTYPIETAMAGLPNLEQTRSLSRYGLSQVTVVFKDGTDIYFARQLVNERIQEAKGKLPGGLAPTLGPIATGLGEIYMWTVEAKPGALKADGSPYTPMDLREIQDWIIKPQLRNVPGVTEINTIGGYAKEYQVAPFPEKLVAYGLTLKDIVEALERNNGNVGAGYIERRGEQYLIRAPGRWPTWTISPTSSSRPRKVCRCGSVTWRTWDWARNCAPAPRLRTAARPCSAPSSCCWAKTAARYPRRLMSAFRKSTRPCRLA